MKKIDSFKDEYRFLSNFYQCDFEFDGLVYHNAEAAFQAQKCKTIEEKKEFALLKNPVIAKRKGRSVKGLNVIEWNNKAPELMYKILCKKFSNEELKRKLFDTGDAILIEGNHWHDNHWGKCYCEKCLLKTSENLLGNILMKIRHEISQSK